MRQRYGGAVPSPTSYRLADDLKLRLAQRAAAEGVSETALVARLLQHGLAQIEHPGIVFRPGPTGWRAGLAGGPDIDEVIRAVRTAGPVGEEGAVAVAAESLGIDQRLVRIAIDYAAEHLEEVEARIAENDAAVERARARAKARSTVIAG